MDIVDTIRAFNAGRDPERLARKYAAMSASPFVFLRGTCHLFYDRVAAIGLPRRAPVTWVCGDLHFENFGSFKGDNRLVYFDMNDFDEAALAPCTWELVRFLASVLVGAAGLGLQRAEAVALCRCFLDAYVAALADGKARWVERETADGMVRQLLDSLQDRPRPAYLDTRTERRGNKRQLRTDGRKALPVTAAQRETVAAFMRDFAAAQPEPKFYKLLDVARRIAGTGSLGVDRYVILVEGKGSPDRNYLIDLKQALPSSLVPHLKIKQPHWASEAARVVAVQRRMQAVSMAFLQAVTLGKSSYILRGLQPSEDRVALDRWDGKLRRTAGVMRTMAEVVAWGQLRSGGRQGSATSDELIDFARREKWRLRLLDAAEHAAAQVEQDWRVYAQAYRDGACANI
ncbi:MAG: DUF2252 domain-containing protein [Rhodocyclaceae bacterium]|nr:DUF2252 domain-containing protein [Rhodocyclaceae bacterium]